MNSYEGEHRDTAWSRFLHKQFPERFKSDEEFVEGIRNTVARCERWKTWGLVLAVVTNLAILFAVCGLLVRVLNVMDNNVPVQQLGVWVGFIMGIVLGMLIGKLEMNFVHSLGMVFDAGRMQRLLLRYFDELQSLRTETTDDFANENET